MSESNRIYTFSHQSLGTTFWVRLAGEDFNFSQKVAEALFYFLDELNREIDVTGGTQLSGQLSLINSLPSGEVLAVTQMFADLWNTAEAFRVESQGAFDVRVGELFKYWQARDASSFNPDDPEWVAAYNRTKESKYHLEGLEFHVVQSGATIDFRAMIHGYAVDRMTETLETTWGVHRALVMAGSSVARALDPPGEGTGWRMALGGKTEWQLCRSAMASQPGASFHLPIIDVRSGTAVDSRGVVRALASSAQEAQYLSFLGAILPESELMQHVSDQGQRGLWFGNNKRMGTFRALPPTA